MNISKTIRDTAISSEFLTHRVVQESPVQRGKISIFATFSAILDLAENEKVLISQKLYEIERFRANF